MALFDRFGSTPDAKSFRQTAETNPGAAREDLDTTLEHATVGDAEERTHSYRALTAVGEEYPEAVAEHDDILQRGLHHNSSVRVAAAAALAPFPHRMGVDRDTYTHLINMVQEGASGRVARRRTSAGRRRQTAGRLGPLGLGDPKDPQIPEDLRGHLLCPHPLG